jgi:hypothetical protein
MTSLRCTECDRVLLNLWREIHRDERGATTGYGRWRATDPTPCKHVTAEQVEVYRFTKRDERDELELPIRAGRGRLRGGATRSPAAKQEAPNRAA